MLKFKLATHLTHPFLLAIALLFPLSNLVILNPSPSLAQTQQRSSQSKFGGFFAPKGMPMPEDSAGGASRGECPIGAVEQDTDSTVIRLVTPQVNSGLTVSAHPAFFAYVNSQVAKQVYFSIKNEDESYFYAKTVPLTPMSSQGLWKFQLPEDAPPLTTGDRYKWSVALICSNQFGPDSPWTSAWVQRIDAPDLATEPAKTQPSMELASAYGKAGLWYDTAAVLFELKTSQGDAAAEAAWQQLLTAEGVKSAGMPMASVQSAISEQ